MTLEALVQLQLQSASWGIKLGECHVSLLNDYADILSRYSLANVIGTTNKEDIILEHLLDSLSCLLVEELHRTNSIVDVGTGGGLPGIPIAIARPELPITLLEATEKKVRFLEYVKENLGLQNVHLLHARAERVGVRTTHRETFDLAVGRALSALPVLIEYCAPLVRTRGAILAMKARLSEAELSSGIAAARELGVALREVRKVEYRAPLQPKERSLVILDKVQVTPDRFPRRVGVAKKRPLGT